MNKIVLYSGIVMNCDNQSDVDMMLSKGARELTSQEIAAAGMNGYEHLVSPANTTVSEDGAITFTPPDPPSSASLFASLRAKRDRRLTATDYLLMPDYPLDITVKEAVQIYRQDLRDLPSQDGAPWDGGGEETPWPLMPELASFVSLSYASETPSGSDSDPYTFTSGIDVYSGKYYSYNNHLYLAKSDMTACVWPPDTEGLWQWELVE